MEKRRHLRDAFNELRDCLAKKNASFETRYYVGLDPKDPLRLPAKNLTMRTMRHTYITLNHDAGVPRELSRGIRATSSTRSTMS